MRNADPTKGPRIVESAAQLFAERPYHEVRMDDIALRSGVAKGTLYLHFKDKESLYLALIEDGLRRQLCDALADAGDVPDPFDRVGFVIRALVAFFDEYPYFLDLIPGLDLKGRGRTDSPLGRHRAEFVAVLRRILEELDASGRLPVADPSFAAICLGGLIYEVLKATPRPWPASLAERIEGQYLYGVGGGPSPAPAPSPSTRRPCARRAISA